MTLDRPMRASHRWFRLSWRRRGDWARDLELVRRRLQQRPLFFAATLATLSIGLGTFAVVYTAVDKILLDPLPLRDPDDLYMVWAKSPELPYLQVTGPDVAELAQAGGVIEDAAAFQYGRPTLPPADGRDAEPIDALASSPNLFTLLGVCAARGRTFGPEDGRSGAPGVVVLSDGLWKRLGADPSILGRTLTLSTAPYTVIGVMPPEFRFSGSSSTMKPDVFVPRQVNLAAQGLTASAYQALIRVRHGTTPEQARQAVDIVGSRVGRRDFKRTDRTLDANGLHAELVDDIRPALLALGFTGGFLVLALTVNLASLLLARAAEREREFAVSRALGASAPSVVRATLLEGVVLGLLGGVGGALAGAWGTRLLVALGPVNLPRRETIALDGGVAAVVIGVGTILGLVAALMPALWVSRISLASLMAGTAVRGAAGPGRMRRGLVVAQVALSLVLLSTGALVARSFNRLLAADPGFEPQGVLTFSLGVLGTGLFREDVEAYAFMDRLDGALRALPGVTAVSATTQLPLSGGGNFADVMVPGAPGNTGDPQQDKRAVSRIFTRSGYVEAMGLRLREGRGFDAAHRASVREAMIDHHLAQRLFPNGGALGTTIMSQDQPLTIVGVVDQPRLFDLHQDDERPQLFVRAEDFRDRRPASYVMRTRGDPRLLVSQVRHAIRQIDRRVPISAVQTMEEVVAARRSKERLSAALIAGLAIGALLLVAMGLFGVISGSVARRRGELALRLALGATHQRVIRLVVGDGARLIVAGSLIGLPGIYLAGQTLQGFLVGVSPFDAPTLAGVVIGLCTVALLACYLAARTVTGINPERLLRDVA